MSTTEPDFNRVIELVLRFGVTMAFAVIALGTILLFIEGQTEHGSLNGNAEFYDNRFFLGLGTLLQGLAAAKPFAIIELGLILLFATPIARVAISTSSSSKRKDTFSPA